MADMVLKCSVDVDDLNRSLESLGELKYEPVTMLKHGERICVLLVKPDKTVE